MEEYVEILEFLTHTHTDTQGVHHVDALLFFLYSCIYPPHSCSFPVRWTGNLICKYCETKLSCKYRGFSTKHACDVNLMILLQNRSEVLHANAMTLILHVSNSSGTNV